MTAPAESARPAGSRFGAAVAVLLALGMPPSGAASAAPWKGESVHLTGVVADSAGRPLAGLAVVLTASRTYFSLRHLQSAEASPRTVSSTTDAAGRYALDWPWDDHYNTFELAVGIPVGPAAAPNPRSNPRLNPMETVDREDISQRMAGGAGGAVEVSITLPNGGYVEKVRRFVATLGSDDERRVYGEMGHPDQVKSVRYPDHDEVSWWYFESGKVYRFESGRLDQVVPFEPVKPF